MSNLSSSREVFSHQPAPGSGEREGLLRESVMSTGMAGWQRNVQGRWSGQECPPAPPLEPRTPGTVRWSPECGAEPSARRHSTQVVD